MRKIHFTETIQATPQTVWQTMLNDPTYRDWASAFCEGTYYEGSWEQGSEMRFLAPAGGGMAAVIAESRPYEFISIKHIGSIDKNGEVDR
jgi:uncharacterized protein YndB with AHSA1/START domain